MNAKLSPQVTGFAASVASAGGLHPLEVFEKLRRAAENGCTESAALYAEGRRLETGMLDQCCQLALPHPLDAEWRFDDDTADQLLALAVEATGPGDAILLLGVPTVALRALGSSVDRRFVVQSEGNVIGQALTAKTAGDERFIADASEGCAGAILDPPWYPAVFDMLVGLAARGCRVGAGIFVGAPSPKVRASVVDERQKSLAAAGLFGLAFEQVHADPLTYRTPAFEIAAMQAGDLGRWLPDWRRGDMLQLRKVRRGCSPKMLAQPPAFELTLEGVRLRLSAQNVPALTWLEPLVPGEVFPSVSMRAAGRKRANLWTSGNRAFACDPIQTLAAMQTLAARHGLWPKGFKFPQIDSATRREVDPIQSVEDLYRIAARELAHMTSLVGEGSWDRSVNDARFLNGSAAAFHRALVGGGA